LHCATEKLNYEVSCAIDTTCQSLGKAFTSDYQLVLVCAQSNHFVARMFSEVCLLKYEVIVASHIWM